MHKTVEARTRYPAGIGLAGASASCKTPFATTAHLNGPIGLYQNHQKQTQASPFRQTTRTPPVACAAGR
jgi:hypothetical protein